MNQNIITKLNLEPRIRDLKQKGYSERDISKTLSDETRHSISKTAIHRCLVKQIEPPLATIEPVPTHQSIAEPEPQHSATVSQSAPKVLTLIPYPRINPSVSIPKPKSKILILTKCKDDDRIFWM